MGTKVIAVLAGLFVLIAAGGAFYALGQNYWWGAKFVPREFADARSQGAYISRKIAFLANQSLAGLEQIAQFDEQKRYSSALKLIEKELKRNEEARNEALLLSSHLETMAVYLPQISPGSARSLATEAVGNEVNLVNRLINFHGLLSRLFELLQGKFTGKIKNGDSEVKKIIELINQEIKTINGLNLKFNSTMEQFDEVYE